MGEDIAISLENICKYYKRYALPADRLKEILFSGKNYGEEFWALREVSFELSKGETLGIIGRNGAGKSTLLQIICRTLQPSSGTIQVNGKVAALLELGAGFNPEFTGRENLYINGTIMGLSQQKLDERFDKVAAFADIGDFIDQAVKTYSSGMYVRLAFASAIHVDPDILIVDEALSVGDMFFQAKCMARMRNMMDSGVTVIFVSHDTASVKSLCQRGLLLEKGQVQKIGKASEVVSFYMGLIHTDTNQHLQPEAEYNPEKRPKPINSNGSQQIKLTSDNLTHTTIPEIFVSTEEEAQLAEGHHRYGDGGARILDIKLLNSQHQPTEELDFKEKFTIQASILFHKDLPTFCFGYLIRDVKGVDLLGTVTSIERVNMPDVSVGQVYVVEMEATNILNAGVYTITFAVELPIVMNQQHIFLDWVNEALVFKVNIPQDPLERFTSKVYAPAEVKYMQLKN